MCSDASIYSDDISDIILISILCDIARLNIDLFNIPSAEVFSRGSILMPASNARQIDQSTDYR